MGESQGVPLGNGVAVAATERVTFRLERNQARRIAVLTPFRWLARACVSQARAPRDVQPASGVQTQPVSVARSTIQS